MEQSHRGKEGESAQRISAETRFSLQKQRFFLMINLIQ